MYSLYIEFHWLKWHHVTRNKIDVKKRSPIAKATVPDQSGGSGWSFIFNPNPKTNPELSTHHQHIFTTLANPNPKCLNSKSQSEGTVSTETSDMPLRRVMAPPAHST